MALLPLKYICDVIDKMGLVKKLDIGLRVYFNTGSIQVPVTSPSTDTTGYGAIASSTFSNTCPWLDNDPRCATSRSIALLLQQSKPKHKTTELTNKSNICSLRTIGHQKIVAKPTCLSRLACCANISSRRSSSG
jgi:hypothetical protein